MDMQKEVARLYKKKQIESASSAELILLLYNAVIERLNRAKNLLNNKKKGPSYIEEFHNHLIISQNIISELMATLDLEKGKDLATKLFQLYEYMNYRLVETNLNKEEKGLQEVIGLLQTLKSGWEDVAIKDYAKAKPQQQSINLQG